MRYLNCLASVSALLQSQKCANHLFQKRNFMRLLTSITNAPDRDRIKAIGPDRSCAEWLLRCGATIRWCNADSPTTDFSALTSLPPGTRQYLIEDVEANEAGIMDIGYVHFDGCRHIKRVRFIKLPYFYDSSLALLADYLQESLEHLELCSCGNVSEDGLQHVTRLRLLKTLILENLPEIKDKEKCIRMIKQSLPQCDIQFNY